MQIRLTRKQQEGTNVWSFFFEAPDKLSWKPGQYLYCTLKHQPQDNRGDRRYFTIASASHENLIRLTTRYFGDKSSSFKRHLFNFKKGDTLEIYPPDGSFTINKTSEKYLWIAGGIGITPFRSMASSFNHNGAFPDIHLIYGNQTPDPVFLDELTGFAEKFPQFKISACIAPDMINQEFINNRVPDFIKRLTYISGPEPMVKSILKLVQDMGQNKHLIKTDYFPGYVS